LSRKIKDAWGADAEDIDTILNGLTAPRRVVIMYAVFLTLKILSNF